MKRLYPHFLVLCVLAALLHSGLVSPLQDALTDLRFRISQRPVTGQVVVVAIDSHSLKEFGVWPWPRRLHANLIQKLREAGVTDIFFDVDLSARSSPADDAAFADALSAAGGAVVLPLFKQAVNRVDNALSLHVNRGLPEFRAHAWEASVNVSAAPDGRVRRYAFGDTIGGEFVPSAAAILASGTFEENSAPFYLDFGIRLQDIPVVSFSDVLNGSTGTKYLRGRKVIVGGTAIELGDRYLVPNAGIISGPKLHALAAESILQRRALVATSSAVTAGGIVALVLLMLVVSMWRPWSLAARTVVLSCLAIAIEITATALQALGPVIVHTAVWHASILAYLVAGLLSDLDLRGMLAKVAKGQFQSIAMSLRDGVICANGRGIVTFCNPAAETIFGHSSKETIGHPLEDFYKIRVSSEAAKTASSAELIKLLTAASAPLEFVGVRKGGQTFPLEISLSAWPDGDGFQYGAILRDITERKREEEQIRYLALHDSLTGVLNRAGLRSALSKALAGSRGEANVALVLIDLDDFKRINDTLGHQAGDEVLRQVADHLRDVTAGGGTIGRLGGDEFAIVIQATDAASRAVTIARETIGRLRRSPAIIEGRAVYISATMGVGIAGPQEQSLDDVLVSADLALYRAKSVERGSFTIYSPKLRHELEQRRSLEQELADAVARNEFELFYQPQVRLCDKAMVGVEALLRWRHPTRGLLAPAQFLDVLNETSLSSEVGNWVIQTACHQGQRWNLMNHAMRIGVNLAPSQLCSDLTAHVESALAETGLPPSLLELEVTENIVLERDGTAARMILERIRARGVGVAFDDFGTGYASLTHLREFPLTRLKIDRSFVRDLQSDEGNAAIVAAVAGLGRRLGISVIAEGVEDAQILSLLQEAGCDEGQGYLFGKPMPAHMIEGLLEIRKQNPAQLIPAAA